MIDYLTYLTIYIPQQTFYEIPSYEEDDEEPLIFGDLVHQTTGKQRMKIY